jgi:tripartite-type tricarboxylate transporter receptor subunit TctC
MTDLRRRSLLTLLAATSAGLAPSAHAAWPDKPIRVIVPFAGGGMGTVFGNMVTDVLQARLGVSAIVDHKPGANAALGTEHAAKSAPDGYTLLMVTTGSMAINPAFYPKLRYDPLRDFTPVGMIWMSRNVLFADPAKAKSLKQLIELGRTRSLTYGSLGVGSLAHLSSEQLIRAERIEAVHVPYKGNGQVMTELGGGNLDFAFTDPSGLAFAQNGRVAALAVTGPQRLPSAPTVPTLAELGYPNVGMMSWLGLVAPAGTPKEIVERISAELTAGFADEAVRAKVLAAGVEVAPDMRPDTFAQELRVQLERWKAFQRETKITIE